MLVYKDGITTTIDDKQWQKFRGLGFVEVGKNAEPKGEETPKKEKAEPKKAK